jgi:glutaminase
MIESGLKAITSDVQNRVLTLGRASAAEGRVTQQIPALQGQDPSKFGVAVATVGGEMLTFGDADESFSLQSISKVFALCALVSLDADAWARIGWGPSANNHNSVEALDREAKPANPFVNAGAIVVTDRLHDLTRQAAHSVQDVLRSGACPEGWTIDEHVASSEAATSHRNLAIAHLLADGAYLYNDPDMVLNEYFNQCAIAGSAQDLAAASLFLADVQRRFCVLPRDERRRINSVLLMSGTYGAAADVSFRIGLPAKSGISGVILAIAPGRGTIVVWSPPLDERGNSTGALVALEELTRILDWSIF